MDDLKKWQIYKAQSPVGTEKAQTGGHNLLIHKPPQAETHKAQAHNLLIVHQHLSWDSHSSEEVCSSTESDYSSSQLSQSLKIL